MQGADHNSDESAHTLRGIQPTEPHATFPDPEVAGSISLRFEAMAHQHPDRVAIRSHGGELTYRELNQAANRVAHAVLARGTSGAPVAILLGQDISVIAAILGVLKSGALYVVLDPTFPASRLSHILDDSQARLLLTNDACEPMARGLAPAKVELLNTDARGWRALPSTDPGIPVSPSDLSYLAYTSGSSGEPKGVMVTHGIKLRLIKGFSDALCVSGQDRFALLHRCGSGASSGDIYGTLLNGATLCVYNVGERGLGPLAAWLIAERITILHWLPTAFRRLVSTLAGDVTFPDLRLLMMGSEPLARSDVDHFRAHLGPDCLIANRYGITEAGNTAIFFMDATTEYLGDLVPVGYGFCGRSATLVDDEGLPVPEGEIGEIVVRSRAFPLGYWRQPELSAQTYQPDPADGAGQIFHSGDLGRFLPGGCLVHLGRKDSQVKVRGYRVELAEVETALLAHPDVNEGAVAAIRDPRGETCIVAYVVAASDRAPTVGEMRRFLGARLPDHMIPAYYVELDALPLTPNDKVDRRALPSPDWGRPDLDVGYVPPRSADEASLIGIWSQVLGMGQAEIGVHDPFVELGGHSLHASQILARVRDAYQIEFTPQEFFEAPTVTQQAAIIARARMSASPPRPKLAPRSPRPMGSGAEE